MKKIYILMTLFVIALVGCANNDNKTRSEAQEKAETTAIEELTPAVEEQVTSEVAPDFTLNDINGKPLALSSLRGKYVILDFWGSWCVWCIRGIPNMKEYYNKYKGKFEILGIDCNDSEQEWKDAVKKHELPWLHVYNTPDSQLLKTYNIAEFYTLLDQLFQ